MCDKVQMRAWALTLAVLCGAGTLTGARANELPSMPPAPDTFLVGDLLRLDAERARAVERAKSAGYAGVVSAPAVGAMVVNAGPNAGEQAAISAMPVVAPVSLLAIYGVGTRLYADVQIQGQTVTYAAGRAQATGIHGTRGASAVQAAYRLRAIRPPCVQMEPSADKPVLELCLGSEP